MREYSLERYATPAEAYAAIVTDAWFVTTEEELNLALADKIPVYAYEFADETAPNYLPSTFRHGAAHTYDIPYIFRGFPGGAALSTTLNGQQEKLSREMIRLWTHVKDLPRQRKWKLYSAAERNYLILSGGVTSLTVGDYERVHRLDFWQR